MSNTTKHHPIQPFLYTFTDRPIFNGIVHDGKHAHVTDLRIVIRWEDNSPATEKHPNFSELYNNLEKALPIEFSIKDYREWQSKLKMTQPKDVCDICNGECEVTWEFENYTKLDECPECDGKGYTVDNRKEKIPDPDQLYQIGTAFFTQIMIEKVIYVMEFLLFDKVVFFGSENPSKGRYVKIDKYEILIMPANK